MTKDKESRPTFKTCPEKVKKAVLENRERLQSVPKKTLQQFENHVIEHVDSELACLDKLKSLKISPRRTIIWESILFDRCIAIWGTKPFTNRLVKIASEIRSKYELPAYVDIEYPRSRVHPPRLLLSIPLTEDRGLGSAIGPYINKAHSY